MPSAATFWKSATTAISGDPSSLLPRCPSLTGTSRSAIRPSPIAFSTDWSTMPSVSNSPGNRCVRSADGNRMSRNPDGFLQCRCGARGLKRRPLAPHPIPAQNGSERKTLDHVNNLRHHSNTIVATLRLYSHRVGTVHSHRRNPHKALGIGLFQPGHCLILLVQTHIDQGNLGSI